MRDNLEAYKEWAPEGARWTQWAKPVMFMSTAETVFAKLEIPEVDWLQGLESNTMIIVDLPGERGVVESLALARMGYRPVPLYNGVDGRVYSMVVKVGEIRKLCSQALMNWLVMTSARMLLPYSCWIPIEWPAETAGTYDNRWCVFPQDMPSAFLLKAGIRRIIVRSEKFRTIWRYPAALPEEGIEIYLCPDRKSKISVVRPRDSKPSYRFSVILGPTRTVPAVSGQRYLSR